MTIKTCRDCGGKYETEDKEVKLLLNHKDIEAIEDRLFCILSEEKHKKTDKHIHKFWKQLCEKEENWKKQ